MREQFIRFGITDNYGHRAATWKIWTPNSKSDIYLSCRELGGVLKASLHQSGSWHFGYNNSLDTYFESEEAFDKCKYIEIWPRPKPIAEGITLAFRIVTPHASVNTPMEPNMKDIKWVSNCSVTLATEIDIIITSYEHGQDNWPGKNNMATKFIGSYKLNNTETLWVVSWEIPVPDLSSLSGNKFQFFKGKSIADLKSTNLKAIIFADQADGSRTLIDCAVKINNCS
jgi:hypothetical protein